MSELILPSAAENLISVRANSYLGRGIVQGISPSGEKAFTGYFITARSAPSKARTVIHETEAGSDPERSLIRVDASAEMPKDADLTNLKYNAMRGVSRDHRDAYVVSNGIHTDSIVNALERGERFETAIAALSYEEDPENTPRIAGVLDIAKGLRIPSSHLALVRRKLDLELTEEERAARLANPKAVQPKRITFHQNLGHETNGTGLLLHTYRQNSYQQGEPVPSFIGAPYRVPVPEDIDEFAETYWDALPEDKRVALVVRAIDLATGIDEYKIINTKEL